MCGGGYAPPFGSVEIQGAAPRQDQEASILFLFFQIDRRQTRRSQLLI